MISFKETTLDKECASLSFDSYFIKNIYKIIYDNKEVGYIKELSKDGSKSFVYNLHIPDNFFGNNKSFTEISRKSSLKHVEKSLAKSIKSLLNKCNK